MSRARKPLPSPAPATCPQCGDTFTPGKPWAKFCSDLCRLRGHRAKKAWHAEPEADAPIPYRPAPDLELEDIDAALAAGLHVSVPGTRAERIALLVSQRDHAIKSLCSRAGESPTETAIHKMCDDLAALLVEKNRSYGNSALEPLAVMSRLTARERLAVRIDDKLSRIARGHEYPGDDTLRDLAGYLVLALVERKMAEATQ